MISSTDYWLQNVDNRNINMTLFLDLKKAFDTVNHQILIEKLFAYGVKGTEIEWFKSYLSDRQQFCSVKNATSSTLTLKCGIPQGSSLGPLLFIVYLNDFEACLEFSRACMYADDTHCTIASANPKDLFENTQKEIVNIAEWMRTNKLSANPQKTEFMIIGNCKQLKKIDDIPKPELKKAEIK